MYHVIWYNICFCTYKNNISICFTYNQRWNLPFLTGGGRPALPSSFSPSLLPFLHGSQSHILRLPLDAFNEGRPAACLGLCVFLRRLCHALTRFCFEFAVVAPLGLHRNGVWGLRGRLLWWCWSQGWGRCCGFLGPFFTSLLALVVWVHVLQHHVWLGELGWNYKGGDRGVVFVCTKPELWLDMQVWTHTTSCTWTTNRINKTILQGFYIRGWLGVGSRCCFIWGKDAGKPLVVLYIQRTTTFSSHRVFIIIISTIVAFHYSTSWHVLPTHLIMNITVDMNELRH